MAQLADPPDAELKGHTTRHRIAERAGPGSAGNGEVTFTIGPYDPGADATVSFSVGYEGSNNAANYRTIPMP